MRAIRCLFRLTYLKWIKADWKTQAIDAAISILEKVEEIAKDTPAVDNKGSRFGNPAFKTFYDKVAEVRSSYLGLRCSLIVL